MDTAFTPPALSRYRLNAAGPMTPAQTEMTAISTPGDVAAQGRPWSPSSPLFWFGALAAVTLGLAAVATTVRVGPAKASVKLGS